jgi:hypothetical protein
MELIQEPLDPNLPPVFDINSGWFGNPGAVMDLTYRALFLKYLKT